VGEVGALAARPFIYDVETNFAGEKKECKVCLRREGPGGESCSLSMFLVGVEYTVVFGCDFARSLSIYCD
jgi:hypothetical protein